MANISYLAETSVERATASVKAQNFNIPAMAVYTTAFAPRSKVYTSPDAFAVDFPPAAQGTARMINLMGLAFFAITPRPEKLKVLRLALPSTKVVVITPTAANLKAFKVKVNGTEVVYTSDASATAQEIVEGLKALIDALSISGLTVTENDIALTLTGGSGVSFSVELTSTRDDGQMTVIENTADPGIATDLTAIQLADKDWYSFALIDQSKAIIDAASSWTQSNGKHFVPVSQDTEVPTSATTDTASTLKTGSRERSGGIWHHAPDQFAAMRYMARLFSAIPGSRAAYHKSLPGLSVSDLDDTQIGHLINKNFSYYVDYGGNNRTDGGKVSSGEWVDIIIGSDYYDALSEQQDAELLLSEVDKLPGDEEGVGKVEARLRAIVQTMVVNKFARLDFTKYPKDGFGIVIPTVAMINPSTRVIDGPEAEVILNGAIKKIKKKIRLIAAA